jgi:hypothetical protein
VKNLPLVALPFFAAVLIFGGCKNSVHVDSTGPDTYTLTEVPGTGFERDTQALKDKAQAEAQKYCDSHGKILKVISLEAKKPLYLTGYVTATIVFEALPPGDPRLTQAPAYAATPMGGNQAASNSYAYATPGAAAAPAPANSPEISGDLYTQLLKLDDLRKKGILTQEEFDEQKKKILARSQ